MALVLSFSLLTVNDTFAKGNNGVKGKGKPGKHLNKPGHGGHPIFGGGVHDPDNLEKYDRNGNGKLDEREIETMREDRWQKVLDKHDSDGNGRLDEVERNAVIEKIKDDKTGRHRWLMVLMRYDKNGDGELSTREERELREQIQEVRQANQ